MSAGSSGKVRKALGRIERINQGLKREISEIIHMELRDPRLEFVTITCVEVTRDLQHAKVYYSVLGTPEKLETVKECFERAKGYIRKLVGERIKMRYTPELNFIFDRSFEYAMRIDDELKKMKGHHE